MRLILLAIVGLSALPAPVHAFRTLTDLPELADADGQPVPWTRFPIAIDVLAQPEDPVDGAATLDAVMAAAELWNQGTCTGDALEVTGFSSAAAVGEDGRNTVQWVHAGWSMHGPRDAVAITESVFRSSGGVFTLIEGDIFINAETLTWGGDMLAHLDGVLAHEMGHLVGLAHPCEPDGADGAPVCDASSEMTLMHPLYDPSRSALTADDENGTCFLYPNGPVDMPSRGSSDEGSGCSVRASRTGRAHVALGLGAALCALGLRRGHWRRRPRQSVRASSSGRSEPAAK